MLSKNKVVLGMSGGVDSSTAALLLKEAGFEVFGVSIELYSCDRPMGKGCCTPADRLDARAVCETLKIPYKIVDQKAAFKEEVIEYFVGEYSRGRTPLPCAPCNKQVKFKTLLDVADEVGAYWIATGHYARVAENNDGSFSLLKAKDVKKDQSYFLWSLSQKELSRLKFPLGDLTKEEVRRIARKAGLAVSDKKDSLDLCFIGREDHGEFLEEFFPDQVLPSGDFVSEEGKILGKHDGLHHYTIGQRRGLGVATGQRIYVTDLDAKNNKIVLGSKNSLQSSGLIAKNPNWIRSSVEGEAFVKIRSAHNGVNAQLSADKAGLKILFQEPQFAITPGQAAVFYQKDELIGGAWIDRALQS